MIGALTRRVFGTENERKLKPTAKLVENINALEPETAALSDADLRARTDAYRARVASGESLDSLLPEAFATVREAAKRALGLRPFDVQLMGGIILHQGRISEMKTGEGKTLVATMPIYLNALAGKGCHVVTVNDYLAKRDAEWMGKVYAFLGLTTGVIVPGLDDAQRRAAYACDVTYATNNELGFDYLRDNMKFRLEDMTQRGHFYAIVDEVDSILVDEARTPLIISGPTQDQSALYIAIDKIIPQLTPEHYEIDEKQKTAILTEEGNEVVEQLLRDAGHLKGETTLYDPENVTLVHHVNQALRAHKLFQRDKDYIVRKGKVVIIDEFTGRMMEGRRWGDGLHQAVEAREGCQIQPENVTMASITFQNYFRLYDKLAGMTGTALTEAEEFQSIYGLDVVEIPTNLPVARRDDDDQVYRTVREKTEAIIEAIRDGRRRGQPILVGTTTIEKSEFLSAELKKRNIPHNVLNARFHEQEAYIVAQAGRPSAVTIATNMAGRGTDIKLGGNVEMRVAEQVGEETDPTKVAEITRKVEAEVEAAKQQALAAGGLWVIGTERHESRRIDNQLRGRSGRQGDPGRSTFFLSLEDDLMRIFGGQRMDGMLQRLGLEEGEAIVHNWVNKAIERAQGKVEARNFDIRKNLLKFDDVMNDQRKAIFGQRREIMEADDVSEIVRDMRHDLVDRLVSAHIPERAYHDQWDTEGLKREVAAYFAKDLPVDQWAAEEGADDETLRERLIEETDKAAAQKAAEMGPSVARQIEKAVLLQTVDMLWREHLITLDHLRSVIGLRGYGQRDPLNEYKSEAFALFDAMLSRLRGEVVGQLAHVRLAQPEPAPQVEVNYAAEAPAEPEPALEGAGAPAAEAPPARPARDAADPSSWGKVGRNEPCPCGSGKKFKHCHGRV